LAALLALPLAGGASLFFVRSVKPPPANEVGIDGAQFPEPEPGASKWAPPPPDAAPAPADDAEEMATVELVEEAPSLFDVPPDHGPLASVPPGEAFHLQEQADLVSRINNALRDTPVLASGSFPSRLRHVAEHSLTLLCSHRPDQPTQRRRPRRDRWRRAAPAPAQRRGTRLHRLARPQQRAA